MELTEIPTEEIDLNAPIEEEVVAEPETVPEELIEEVPEKKTEEKNIYNLGNQLAETAMNLMEARYKSKLKEESSQNEKTMKEVGGKHKNELKSKDQEIKEIQKQLKSKDKEVKDLLEQVKEALNTDDE